MSIDNFTIKDSGKREQFEGGMVRDTEEGKVGFHRVLEGPMLNRWAVHLSKGAVKYPDNEDGTANWTKAAGVKELRRYQRSAFRHFMQWMNGDVDEDHAAAVIFNLNGAEYVKAKLGGASPGSQVQPQSPRSPLQEPEVSFLKQG